MRGSTRDWSAALREETGIDIGYRRTGGVDVAWTDREDQELRAAAGRWRAEGIAYERLAPGDYARVEPALNPELKAVYYLPDRAQVRNPRLLRALMAAVSRRGAGLMPWHGVEGFAIHDGRVAAVRTSAGRSALRHWWSWRPEPGRGRCSSRSASARRRPRSRGRSCC